MALLLPRSVFIHIPKTGGSWVRKAILNAGIPVSEAQCPWHTGVNAPWTLGKNGNKLSWRHICYHASLHQIDPGDRFTFTFVRNPLDVYVSYWRYKNTVGWDPLNGSDNNVRHDCFENYVRDSLGFSSNTKGSVTQMYEWFIDGAEKKMDFIGRRESLADDLVKALRLAGETFDEQALRATPPENVSTDVERSEYSPELKKLVLEKEARAISRFGYGSVADTGSDHPVRGKTGLFIGRFQPFHEGHKRCVEKILSECQRCIILLRNTAISDKNPFDLEKRTALIRAYFPDGDRVLIRSVDDPGAELNVYIGRDVGYGLIRLEESIEAISATDIRRKLYAENPVSS